MRATAAVALLAGLGLGIAHGASLQGVNLSGAEDSSSKLPGHYGKDYLYPNPGEVSYFTGKGMNVFRVPVLWERLQPALNGPLDDGEVSRLSGVVDAARQHGAAVIIDVHDYGRYRGTPIGQGHVTAAAFADLWVRLANLFRGQDVLFGLMNEPQLPDAATWAGIEQQVINAIRGIGADNRILVSGIGWDGAHSFVRLNGPALAPLHDPRNRLVFEVHQYFDANSSGTTDTCTDPEHAVGRLTSFTQWLRTHPKPGFLGEFGVSRRPECAAVLEQVLADMKANTDVWLGWTYWAAGPRWGNYMFTVEPDHGQDRPQMAQLLSHLGAAAR